jgi:hypothetical protein
MHAEIFYPSGRKGNTQSRETTWVREEFYSFVESWARWAEKNPCPFAYDGEIAGRAA